MTEDRFQPLGRVDQLAEIEAGFKSSAFQHVDHIFGGDISCRRRRERAAPDAAAAGIDHVNPGVYGGRDIGETSASRVVEVQA